jgi:hypothetical protein
MARSLPRRTPLAEDRGVFQVPCIYRCKPLCESGDNLHKSVVHVTAMKDIAMHQIAMNDLMRDSFGQHLR